MPGKPGAFELSATYMFAIKLKTDAFRLAFVSECQVDVDLLLP